MNIKYKKTKKCAVCGKKDQKEKYITLTKQKIKVGDRLKILEEVILCEECATLGMGV